MENINTTTTPPQVPSSPRVLAVGVLWRCGELILRELKATGRSLVDPMTCSFYWIGSSPNIWRSVK